METDLKMAAGEEITGVLCASHRVLAGLAPALDQAHVPSGRVSGGDEADY